jgi:hypothetical protein
MADKKPKAGEAAITTQTPDGSIATSGISAGTVEAPKVKPADRAPKVTTETVRLGAESDPLPAGPLVLGGDTVEVPDEATQRAGFETKDHYLLTSGGYGFKYVKNLAVEE